jgi:hypothetical protein
MEYSFFILSFDQEKHEEIDQGKHKEKKVRSTQRIRGHSIGGFTIRIIASCTPQIFFLRNISCSKLHSSFNPASSPYGCFACCDLGHIAYLAAAQPRGEGTSPPASHMCNTITHPLRTHCNRLWDLKGALPLNTSHIWRSPTQHSGPIPTYQCRIPVFPHLSCINLKEYSTIFPFSFSHLYFSSPNPNFKTWWIPTLARLTVKFGFSWRIWITY